MFDPRTPSPRPVSVRYRRAYGAQRGRTYPAASEPRRRAQGGVRGTSAAQKQTFRISQQALSDSRRGNGGEAHPQTEAGLEGPDDGYTRTLSGPVVCGCRQVIQRERPPMGTRASSACQVTPYLSWLRTNSACSRALRASFRAAASTSNL